MAQDNDEWAALQAVVARHNEVAKVLGGMDAILELESLLRTKMPLEEALLKVREHLMLRLRAKMEN